jgi:hypothetical protein
MAAIQMEMRMIVLPPAPFVPVLPPQLKVAPRPPVESASKPFGAWLLEQVKRPGSLGELAKAAKSDRLFPKNGSADDARRRFGDAGADGDAFAALDDAEHEYDQQMR